MSPRPARRRCVAYRLLLHVTHGFQEYWSFQWKKPVCNGLEWIGINRLWTTCTTVYPSLEYIKRVWDLHKRCISLVSHLPLPNLYQLLDSVELTFLSESNPPKSEHGVFCAQPICKEEPVQQPVGDNPVENPMPVPAVSHCTNPRNKHVQVEPVSLPPEIWDLVLEYDIGRLRFVIKTASQLAELDSQSQAPSQNPRFTIEALDSTSSAVRIYVISIGGRPYIGNLSNQILSSGTHDNKKCFGLCGSNFLATKSDGVGVVDIALEQKQDGGWSTKVGFSTIKPIHSTRKYPLSERIY